MKKTSFLFCSIFFAAAASAQGINGPTGFLDVDFGVSIQKAKRSLYNKNDMELTEEYQNGLFYSGTFAGEYSQEIKLFFIDDKFAVATIVYRPSTGTLVSTYQKIQALLIKKYGAPAFSEMKYAQNYTKEETEFALLVNKAWIDSSWTFSNTNAIELRCENIYVILKYYNILLKKQLDNAELQRAEKDL